MAEILLDEINVISSSDITAQGLRIVSADSSLGVSSEVTTQVIRFRSAGADVSNGVSVSVLAVRIQSAKGALSFRAETIAETRLIKYVKTGLSGAASTLTSGHKYKTVSGALMARSTVETYHSDRDIKDEMHDYLPRYYEEFDEVETLVKSGANESVRLQAKLTEILDQFYVDSASYGLNRWRNIADINDEEARSSESQRDFIKAKLRGVGTITPAHLKSVVDAFYESEISEDIGAYKVRIKFADKRGKPRNIGDIERAIDDVIPAHLEPVFDFTYLPWFELDMIKREWAEVVEYTFVDVEEFEWRFLEGEGMPWNQLSEITAEEMEESYYLNERGIT